MAFREKDQADFDLETFIDLFDTAMTSDNPAVKKALKNLILISTLVDAKSDYGSRHGPLRRLVEEVKHLNQRLTSLEMEKQYKSTYTPPPGTGTWCISQLIHHHLVLERGLLVLYNLCGHKLAPILSHLLLFLALDYLLVLFGLQQHLMLLVQHRYQQTSFWKN
jgi:hypothetical protein